MRRSLLLAGLLTLVACPAKPPPPKPGPLQAGVATVTLDAPVGVALGGYGRHRQVATEKGSTWANNLPASTGVQSMPTARAVALSDGVTKIVVVRLHLCLTTATLRFRAETALRQRGYDASLYVVSTHTHAGPARYFRPAPAEGSGGTDPTALAMDTFDPEVEDRLGLSIADAAAKALDALKPASVGVASLEAGDFNHDRRCENDDLYGPDFRDKTLTVVRIDETDEAGNPVRPMTGFINYAMHGTVLGSDNSLMSIDAPGAMEMFGSDAVGVPLVYMQGSAGDVSPSTGPLGHGDFQGMERIGRVAAPLIVDAFNRAAPPVRPAEAKLVRFERTVDLSREAIGYARGEYAEFGGIGCGFGGGACPPEPQDPKSVICIPLKKRPFSQTTVMALRLESVVIGALPGEPTTAIGERVKKLSDGMPGITHHLVSGYAQDHYGYILEEPDFLRMGYEPSVSPWGWKFGDFIVGQLGQAMTALGTTEPAHGLPDFPAYERRVPTDGPRAAAVTAMPAGLERLGTAVMKFEGGDPGLGTPEVSLEREEGSGFVAVMASAVRKVVNGPDIVLRYSANPTYVADATATTRTHTWTAEWETLPDTQVGRYRLVARGRAKVGGTEAPYELISTPFALTAATSAGTGASAALDSGTLAVKLRFPPNPTVTDALGVVTANFRLRDAYSSPSDGAVAQGGSAQATVTLPDATTQTVTLTWDAAKRAHVAQVAAQTGSYQVHLATHALTDGSGNTNDAPVDVSFTR